MAIVNREDDIIDDVPMDVPDEVALKEWRTDKALSLCMLISLVGFFTAAFFLSRSYVILLYIMLGMVTGWYSGVRERWAGMPGFSAQRDWFKWCVVSVISVIVLWVVVKVLFVLAGS